MRREVDSGDELWCGRVDRMAHDLPFIVEIQSWMYHASLIDVTADAKRISALRSAGFVVAEIKDSTVWTRPREVVSTVREGRLAASGVA